MPRQTLLGDACLEKVLIGVRTVAEPVISTLGPLGRNVIITRKFFPIPLVTKDGVTVAREIDTLADPFENQGAQLVKEAAGKTNDAAGDGTTTATLLAWEMMKEGRAQMDEGKNAIHIRRGMLRARDALVEELEEMSQAVDDPKDYEAVATISAQDEEVGKLVAEVLDEVGSDGIVTVEPGQTLHMEKEVVEGMQFEQGYISGYFVTNPVGMKCEIPDAPILVTDEKIHSIEQILPVIEQVGGKGIKHLVIIADSVEGEALTTLVLNKLKGNFTTLAVRGPAFGERRREYMKDIAALTGAVFVTRELGLKVEETKFEDLGRARKVISTKDSTMIVDGAGTEEDVEKRINEIRIAMESATDDFDKEKMQERIARLTSGAAIIKVGAATEVEMREKQHRVEDAIAATKAAAEEGIVAGGGIAYLRAAARVRALKQKGAFKSDDEKLGFEIVLSCMKKPLYWIAKNSGLNGEEVVDKVEGMEENEGFNAESGEYEDMVKSKIIDPKKVVRSAIENAVSVAATFLQLAASVTDLPETEEVKRGAPRIG